MNGNSTDSPAEAAAWYLKQGFSPIPIPLGAKNPVHDKWERLRINEQNYTQFFNGKKQNIGVLLGIGGVADVDLDCSEACCIATDFIPETGMVFGHKSKAGSHRFFRTDPVVKTRQFHDPTRSGKKSMIVELRGSKSDGGVGLQTVVPPSMHESGEAIEFLPGVSRMAKNVDADVLVQAVSHLAATVLLGRHWPSEGSRHYAFLALAGMLSRAGFDRADIFRIHGSIYRIIWGATASLVNCAKEVDTTIEKLAANQPVTAYSRLSETVDPRVLKCVTKWLRIKSPGPDQPKPKRPLPEVFTAEQLLTADLPDIEPIIDDLLYPGVTLLVGRPKVGKSWFALLVALAIVRGTLLAGHFRVRKPGRVLYLGLEESQRRTASRMRKLLGSAMPDEMKDLMFVYQLDTVTSGGGADQLDRLLIENPCEVLIVDTLLKATRSGSRNSNIVQDDYDKIGIFSALAAKHNCAILLIHHSKKASGEMEAVDACISTSGTTASADAILHFTRGKADHTRLLATTGREIDEETFEFQFDLDAGGFLFTAQGVDVNRSTERNEIVELLEEEGKPMKPVAIAGALKKNRTTVRRLLQSLYNDGSITKTLSGEYFTRKCNY